MSDTQLMLSPQHVHDLASAFAVITCVVPRQLSSALIQRCLLDTHFCLAQRSNSCLDTAGTPEAQGKADYVSSLVAEINHRKGFTAGLSQVLARAAGSLSKRRTALHQVSAKHICSASHISVQQTLICSASDGCKPNTFRSASVPHIPSSGSHAQIPSKPHFCPTYSQRSLLA